MASPSLSRIIPPRGRARSIFVAGSKRDWAHDASLALLAAERAEADISYASTCQSEGARKLSGSYYTPADVADFFWGIFFSRAGISSSRRALKMLDECIFIEPSAGAGALFFSLLKKLVLLGLSPAQLEHIRVDLIDLNDKALGFASDQLRCLEHAWGVRLRKIRLIHGDFRSYRLSAGRHVPVFFGNPPFVAAPAGSSKWKNIFADFVELALIKGKGAASLQLIVPLSLAFSRDYAELRHLLRRSSMDISVASFDNIPDTLFKAGKPKHTNTNKANSQRCCILTAVPAEATRISATKLHRWPKGERARLLSSVPEFFDVTQHDFDDQFPRPASAHIARYLQSRSRSKALSSLLSDSAKFRLIVAPVARNYIGFRERHDRSCHALGFDNKEDFLTALGVLSSDMFFEYWLTVGDGFHLTKGNILNFPISPSLEKQVRRRLSTIAGMWARRRRFEKTKLNSGKQARSFDFSSAALKLARLSRQ